MITTPEALEQWVSKRKATLSPLAGDGSTRSFYRVQFPDTPSTRILLFDPGWVFSKDYPVHQAYLKRRGLPVPEFYEVDVTAGTLVMEDLGDRYLQHEILEYPSSRLSGLIESIELLANLHGRTYPVAEDLPVSARRFDGLKYLEEWQFLLTHLHEGFLKNPALDAGELNNLKSYCDSIGRLGPSVFCHRDYHTRNLMRFKNRLFIIDFQDARLGPIEYDLASVLYDAYITLSEPEKRALLDRYRLTLESFPLSKEIDWKNLEARLHRIAYQRVLKAAGSFASFYTRFKKSTHLPYLLPALKTAQWLEQRESSIPNGLFPIQQWIDQIQTGRKI